MKNKSIVILIIILVIIVLIGIMIGVKMSEKNENISNSNLANSGLQNNDNQISNETTEENQENTQLETTINNEENSNLGSDNMNNQSEEIKINLVVNNKTFSATLENNQTTRELVSMFPMTLNMSEMNSNEKYNYLDSSLTTNTTSPRRINAGDIKLYGNDCLVVFYKSFSTPYSYTNLGSVDNVDAFVSELGSGNVNITFELAN